MVNQKEQLSSLLSALSDPSRRLMVELLSTGTKSVEELSKPFSMSAPAISKHLRVLEKAGMIEREKVGREVFVTLDTSSLRSAQEWFDFYEKFWKTSFKQLKKHLES